MSGTAKAIGIAYLVIVVVGALVAVGIGRSTRTRRPTDPARLAERERTWLIVVLALLVAILFGTIFLAPYGQSAAKRRQVVNVTAQQFVWIFRPASARAGEQVEFRLTSKDVSHGFGLYDPGGTFVLQAQVVPGKTQTVLHTFHRTGTYSILCLEYCGLGHASMAGKFRVTK